MRRRQRRNEMDRFFAEMEACCLSDASQCDDCTPDDDEEIEDGRDGDAA